MKVKSIFYKPLLLLAHPAGVEPATLSTANCASRYSGIRTCDPQYRKLCQLVYSDRLYKI